MTMTKTNPYKKTNTKTKTHIQRQRHTYTDKDKYKVLPRPNVCYIYQKQGVQGFRILYWLFSCDDKDKDKDSKTQTKTNTKCFQDPIYAIFFKSRGFKDLKYYIGCLLVMTQTKTKTQFYALLGVNIFQG